MAKCFLQRGKHIHEALALVPMSDRCQGWELGFRYAPTEFLCWRAVKLDSMISKENIGASCIHELNEALIQILSFPE
eukprot:g34572.t1